MGVSVAGFVLKRFVVVEPCHAEILCVECFIGLPDHFQIALLTDIFLLTGNQVAQFAQLYPRIISLWFYLKCHLIIIPCQTQFTGTNGLIASGNILEVLLIFPFRQ